MDLNLPDEQLKLLVAELDRHRRRPLPLSPRIAALREIRALMKKYPERPPPAPQRHYEPPVQ